MKNRQRLLLFDLDDTLLSSDKTISIANKDALCKCAAMGMRIGYVTARSPRKVGSFLEGLPCDGIAYYNGATIFADTLVEKNEISYHQGIETILQIQQAYLSAKIGVYLEPYNYFDGILYHIPTGEKVEGTIADLPKYDIQRIRIVFPEDSNIELQPYLCDQMNHYVTSDGTAIIVNERANKAHAAKTLADHFQIPLADVIAFGDDVNDIDMLQSAGIGVAMGNAADYVKAAADAVTDTNDNDGVALWINENLLTGKI